MDTQYAVLIAIGILIQQVLTAYYIVNAFDLKFKTRNVFISYILFVGIPQIIIYTYSVFYSFPARSIVAFVIVIVFCFIVSGNRIMKTAVLIIVLDLIMISADLLGVGLITITTGGFDGTKAHFALGTFTFLPFFLILMLVFLNFYKKKKHNFGLNHIKWFLPFVLVQVVFITATFLFTRNGDKELIAYYVNTILFLFIGMDLFFFLNLRQMVKKEVLDYKYAQLENQRNIEYSYIMDQVSQIEKYNAFNHDINEKLVIISSLLEESDDKRGLDMLNEMVSEAEHLKSEDITGNPAIDALLALKCKTANDNDVSLDMKIELPKDLWIRDMDLCSIFSNTLDNAIEACINMEDGQKRWIECSSGIDSDGFHISVKNSMSENSKKEKIKLKKMTVDSGLGLSIIEDVLKKYSGHMETQKNSSSFQTNIFIPWKRN